MFEPSMRMQSAFWRSCWKVVAPPLPNDVPKLGTVEECHMRAWFSIWMAPRAV
jgi:metal-sulfur cluster biosynthetic enzyme